MERKRRDYPWRRNHRRLLLVVFCFFGTVALALAALDWRGESSLQTQVAAIRAKGEPVTPQEFRQQHPDPPLEKNAAETYVKSFNSAKDILTTDDFRKRAGSIGSADTKELLKEEFRQWAKGQLAANADALLLLHEAADKPSTQFSMDLEKGWQAEIPNLMKVRNSVTLLQLEALLAAQDGDTERAVEAFRAGLAVSNALRGGPCLILQMIRIACYGITCAGLRPMLEITRFSDDQLARMQGMLGAADDPDALTRALIGERVMTLVAFDHPDQLVAGLNTADEWLPGGKAVAAGLLRMAGTASGTRERYLAVMAGAIDASRRPPHEALPLLQQAAGAVDRDRAWIPPLSLSRMMPNFYRSEVQLARSLAMTRCAVTALAVERYRLANSRLPEAAEALAPAFMPAVPADPFNGQTLRYKPVEDGCLVYSVGEDQTDNGGELAPRNGNDVVFRVVHGQ
jgi:hypothetical protein